MRPALNPARKRQRYCRGIYFIKNACFPRSGKCHAHAIRSRVQHDGSQDRFYDKTRQDRYDNQDCRGWSDRGTSGNSTEGSKPQDGGSVPDLRWRSYRGITAAPRFSSSLYDWGYAAEDPDYFTPQTRLVDDQQGINDSRDDNRNDNQHRRTYRAPRRSPSRCIRFFPTIEVSSLSAACREILNIETRSLDFTDPFVWMISMICIGRSERATWLPAAFRCSSDKSSSTRSLTRERGSAALRIRCRWSEPPLFSHPDQVDTPRHRPGFPIFAGFPPAGEQSSAIDPFFELLNPVFPGAPVGCRVRIGHHQVPVCPIGLSGPGVRGLNVCHGGAGRKWFPF